ncbi:hypothetical protein MYSTI_07956 [Myxococcus stipitatus DSM 14675]|uniref:DUF4846 domain-containing protein n=1 Tax=Myxococcus stipitatus (strain DSM 14675 / JCM 12634 / Mx s8) TaxID=1278073 RepID=L7UMI9_MYXSD|nr:hypothetical protein MYSTI_07956 [Myxococcus stipitatus DSM 14675]
MTTPERPPLPPSRPGAKWLPRAALVALLCPGLASAGPASTRVPRVMHAAVESAAPATTDAVSLRAPSRDELARYAWLAKDAKVRPLDLSIPAPEGYTRVAVESGSFAEWLRGLPLRAEGTPVLHFRGGEVLPGDDARLAAVAELDIGTANLQQCADSVIRLHAEWLWSRQQREQIAYRFTSGHLASWPNYAAGDRARISGAKVTWVRSAAADSSRAAFRSYLDLVFTYAGTLSLATAKGRPTREDLRAGDFFVLGGSPGHAVLVLDVAADAGGRRVALLGQGFMPAQDFHVLSPGGALGPWFPLEGEAVATPFWKPFPWTSARRFP